MLALIVGAFALGLAGIGVQLAQLLRGEWGLLFYPFGMAVGAGLIAFWLVKRPFGATAALTLGDGVVRLDRWGLLRQKAPLALPWSGIAALHHLQMPYSRLLGFELTPEEAVAQGLRQPTFRTTGVIGPGPLVVWCPGHGFEVEAEAVLAALTRDLVQAGYALDAQNKGRILPVGKRWALTPALADNGT